MIPNLEARVAYGRSIRQRAACLLEAHGPEAEAEALQGRGRAWPRRCRALVLGGGRRPRRPPPRHQQLRPGALIRIAARTSAAASRQRALRSRTRGCTHPHLRFGRVSRQRRVRPISTVADKRHEMWRWRRFTIIFTYLINIFRNILHATAPRACTPAITLPDLRQYSAKRASRREAARSQAGSRPYAASRGPVRSSGRSSSSRNRPPRISRAGIARRSRPTPAGAAARPGR